MALDLFLSDDTGAGITLTSGMATVQVGDGLGNAVANMAVTPGATAGWGTASADSTLWPIGDLPAQLTATVNGLVQISDTFMITIQPSVA